MSIEGRPAVVDRRSRYGDWEGDTIVGANRRGGAVTLVERKSGYLLLGKVPNLQAATVRQAAARRYRTTPPALRKTLTLDNGKEFAEHEQLEVEAALKDLLCEALLRVATWHEREHQRPDPPVLSQGHGPGQHS